MDLVRRSTCMKTLLLLGFPISLEAVETSASLFTASFSMVEIYDLNALKWTANSSSAAAFTISDPALFVDPNEATGSFGWSVSINQNWLAVGSPFYNGSSGVVYIYRNLTSGNNYSWSLFQTIPSPVPQSQFGWSLKLNKADTQYSWSLVIGNGNPNVTQVYLYEYTGSGWAQTYIFHPDYTVMPLTFNPKYYAPSGTLDGVIPFLTMNTANGFGYAVGCYDDAVIVGEPYDRQYYEFSGSSHTTKVQHTFLSVALAIQKTSNKC